jgi:RimJ/RimL family protein N-acetyltransferase
LDFGWNDRGLNRIVAILKPENTRSIKLLEKLGFKFDRNIQLPGFEHKDALYVIDRLN